MDASRIKAVEAGLAAQETTYDEACMRFYVTRREARVDVRFRTIGRDGDLQFPGMEPMWLVTALLGDDGLRLVDQQDATGEDLTELFPSLAAHLAAHPPAPVVDPVDVRFLRVSGHTFRVRRFNRGFGEAVRVDLRVGWTDGAPAAWLHAFDGELMPSVLGHAASLRIGATSETFARPWGQIEHPVRFAAYAALVSDAPSEAIASQLHALLAWGPDESTLSPKGGT